MPESEMVQRVAWTRFIQACAPATGTASWYGAVSKIYETNSRAMITAMREPTDAMVEAGCEIIPSLSETDCIRLWQAMIDAAVVGEST